MAIGDDTDSRLGAGDGNEVPVELLRLYERVYPFGWLGLLAGCLGLAPQGILALRVQDQEGENAGGRQLKRARWRGPYF